MMSKALISISVFLLILFFGGTSAKSSADTEMKYNMDSTYKSYKKWSTSVDSINIKMLEHLKTNKKHD